MSKSGLPVLEKPPRSFRRAATRLLAIVGVMTLVVWLGGVRLFAFPGVSMVPAVNPGDYFVGLVGPWKLRAPQRFDLLIFDVPPTSKWATAKIPWMKRVVGLPGEKVRLAGAQLFVDGRPVPAPFLHRTASGASSREWEIALAADQYCVVGDNLDSSFDDSRTMGPIDRSLIRGFVVGVFRTGTAK